MLPAALAEAYGEKARGGTPIARLTPIRPPSIVRRFGALKGVTSAPD